MCVSSGSPASSSVSSDEKSAAARQCIDEPRILRAQRRDLLVDRLDRYGHFFCYVVSGFLFLIIVTIGLVVNGAQAWMFVPPVKIFDRGRHQNAYKRQLWRSRSCFK